MDVSLQICQVQNVIQEANKFCNVFIAGSRYVSPNAAQCLFIDFFHFVRSK
jgi:hypothetical protein